MSTLSLTPAFSAPRTAGPAVPLRFTRRGKTVLLLGFLAVAMVAMVVFGSLAVAPRPAGTPEPVRVVQVESGDTLYGLAGDIAGPGEIRSMVHRIKELNSLDSTTLEVGQRLAVPRG